MCLSFKRNSTKDEEEEGKGGGGRIMGKVKTCVEKKIIKKPNAQIINVDLEGINQTDGLIFKVQFSVTNPYSCDIPKFKGDYTLKTRGREIARGSVTPELLKAKAERKMDLVVKVSFERLKNMWEEIENIVDDGLIKHELDLVLTFSLAIPITLNCHFEGQKTVSKAWEELLSIMLPKPIKKAMDLINEGVKTVMDAVTNKPSKS